MFPRSQPILRAALGLLLFGLLPSLVFADSWGRRTDIGVAAVERKTGQVRWEAWQQEDVPKNVAKAGRATIRSVLTDSWRDPEAKWPDFPAALSKDRVVNYVDTESGPYFVLAHGKPSSIGAEIARFPFDNNARWRYAPLDGTLYCLREAQLRAYPGTIKKDPRDKTWTPSWTFDLAARLPVQERDNAPYRPMDLHVNAVGVWVVHGPRILQFTPDGRLQAQLKLKNTNPTWFDYHLGTPLTFGKHLIYYRSTNEVIALDWQRHREVWRISTHLSPNVSRAVEMGDDLVLIQIGSDVPRTIQSVLGVARDAFPKLRPNTTKQRVAAAMLLHSYGDGYLRKQLREYREQLRKLENDPDAKSAAAILDNLLGTWPKNRDQHRLIETCVTALLKAEQEASRTFVSPATQRRLTWCLLQELIYGHPPDAYDGPGYNYAYHSWDENRLSLEEERAVQLAEHCRHVLARGPEVEKPFAASVLLSRSVGWFQITSNERKSLFLAQQPSVWRWAAMSLAKNGWREELVQWAPQRPAADHLDLLWILAHRIPKKWTKAELDFWLRCARRTPGGVAQVLNLHIEGEIPVAFRTPIRSYLEQEIANPAVKKFDSPGAGDLFAAIYLLDRWRNPGDTALLLKYVKHPCIRLRGHVKDLLEKRGVKPPPGIVYEETDEQGKD